MDKFKIQDLRLKIQKSSIFNFQSLIKCKGFTLLELMVVVAIIVLLAGIMVPNLAKRIERAKVTRAEADIAAMETAIAMYETDMGGYFGDVNGDISHVNTGLTGQWVNPGDKPENWAGPYIKGTSNDPWGLPYRFFDKNSKDDGTANDLQSEIGSVAGIPDLDYYIYSWGKDKQPGTADDINNWDVNKSWKDAY